MHNKLSAGENTLTEDDLFNLPSSEFEIKS